jgi:hypothetical protein
MPARDPAERSEIGRIGAHTLHATHNSRVTSAPGRAAANGRFERQIREQHPDLPDDEVVRRAAHARKAHMLQLARKSAAARRERGAA